MAQEVHSTNTHFQLRLKENENSSNLMLSKVGKTLKSLPTFKEEKNEIYMYNCGDINAALLKP